LSTFVAPKRGASSKTPDTFSMPVHHFYARKRVV
jgi:hypothetical protein